MPWPTCRLQRRGPRSQNNKKTYSLSLRLGTNMSKQNMCFRSYDNTSNFMQSRQRDKLWCDFCPCVTFSTGLWIIGCVLSRAYLSSSSTVKSGLFRFFVFTCRRVENPDSQKYVLGKRSNNFFSNIWKTIRHLHAKITNCFSFQHVFGPRIVSKVDEFIFHAICTILNWNNKKIFRQIQFALIISGKYSTIYSRVVLNNFRCHINMHFITSRCGTISNIAKFPAWTFRFPLSSFSTNVLRMSIKSTIVLPLSCSFRVTSLSCWNMSARYVKRKIIWLFSRLDTICFFLDRWKLILILVAVQTLGLYDFFVTTKAPWYKIEGSDVLNPFPYVFTWKIESLMLHSWRSSPFLLFESKHL